MEEVEVEKSVSRMKGADDGPNSGYAKMGAVVRHRFNCSTASQSSGVGVNCS